MKQYPIIRWHFKELKLRLFYLGLGFSMTFLIGYLYSHEVLFLFTKPLVETMNKETMPFIFTDLTEAFFIQMEGSFILAILVCFCPLFLFHLWVYLKPALYEYEGKAFTWMILLFLMSLSIGFLFGYSKIIPLAWEFFIGFELQEGSLPYSISLEARIKDYIDLLFQFTCFILFAFQIPSFIGIALWNSWIPIENLIEKRPYLFFSVWVLAALITPPDLISQILLVIPLYLLIELGFLLFFLTKDIMPEWRNW